MAPVNGEVGGPGSAFGARSALIAVIGAILSERGGRPRSGASDEDGRVAIMPARGARAARALSATRAVEGRPR